MNPNGRREENGKKSAKGGKKAEAEKREIREQELMQGLLQLVEQAKNRIPSWMSMKSTTIFRITS